MTDKTFILTCPILTAIMIGLVISMVVSVFPYVGIHIDPIAFSNSIMLIMFFVVPGIGVVAKVLIRNKYMAYIPESKDWIYKFKQGIDNLDFSPELKEVSWVQLNAAVPSNYKGIRRTYALLLLIDSLRGKIPSKGVPPEAKDFISKHYGVYIGLLLH